MAVYDTEENQRSKYTSQTLESLVNTTDFNNHRIIVIDNNSCIETKNILEEHEQFITIITNTENVGTAKAINQAWAYRKPNEVVIKMDNDVVINNYSGFHTQGQVCSLRRSLH